MEKIDGINGREIPNYKINDRWEEFLNEFDIKIDFENLDFLLQKSKYALKKELTKELKGKKVIGMVAGPNKEVSNLEYMIQELSRTLKEQSNNHQSKFL